MPERRVVEAVAEFVRHRDEQLAAQKVDLKLLLEAGQLLTTSLDYTSTLPPADTPLRGDGEEDGVARDDGLVARCARSWSAETLRCDEDDVARGAEEVEADRRLDERSMLVGHFQS